MKLPPILLFFDINKSILVKDASSGKGTLQSLNSILSECVWGKYDTSKPFEERNEFDWKVCSDFPAVDPPDAESLTFGNFLEDFTKVSKARQKAIKTNFVHESFGNQFLPFYDQLLQKISLPSTLSTNIPSFEMFSDGFYHILPSFFRFIDYMVLNRFDFYIVFRSFGVDTGNVVREFNMYCEGTHPYETPVQKLDGTDEHYPIDLRIRLPFHSGSLLRTSEDAKGIHFSYIKRDNILTTLTGAKEIYQLLLGELLGLRKKTMNNRMFVLRDDFQHWHRHHESDDAGKIMLVDTTTPADTPDSERIIPKDMIQIFFDDNIERAHPHIIDVRDINTFQKIPFSVSNDYFIKRVEPYAFLTDPEYYIKIFQEILKKHISSSSQNKEL